MTASNHQGSVEGHTARREPPDAAKILRLWLDTARPYCGAHRLLLSQCDIETARAALSKAGGAGGRA